MHKECDILIYYYSKSKVNCEKKFNYEISIENEFNEISHNVEESCF